MSWDPPPPSRPLLLSLSSPACVSPSHVFPAVESLYAALKSIDRMDIVTMLEGQPPQPARQGSRDFTRRRNNRDNVSPGMTNGELTSPNLTLQPRPHKHLTLRHLSNKQPPPYPLISAEGKGRVFPSEVSLFFSYLYCLFWVMLLCMEAATNVTLLQDFAQATCRGTQDTPTVLQPLLCFWLFKHFSIYSFNVVGSKVKHTKKA